MSGAIQCTSDRAVQPAMNNPTGRARTPGNMEAIVVLRSVTTVSNSAFIIVWRKLTKTKLGSAISTVLLLEMDVDTIHETSVDLRSTGQAHAESEVMKTSNANTFVICALENAGYCCEEH